MSRLTKDIRERMARKLVAHRYTDEGKELVRLNRTLTERIYNHCYTPEMTTAMELIRKHFPNAFETNHRFNVNAGGYRVQMGAAIRSRWVHIEQVAQPERLIVCSYDAHDISKDEALTKEVQEFAKRRDAFSELCQTAYHEAMSVLDTMTTGKKLAAAWPEAMPVIGDLIPESERTLPVVQVSAINAKFGLPPETAAV